MVEVNLLQQRLIARMQDAQAHGHFLDVSHLTDTGTGIRSISEMPRRGVFFRQGFLVSRNEDTFQQALAILAGAF